jgi:PPIC-type PPIASE domain
MRMFREPLFHFLILGAVIFAAHGLIARHKTDKPGEIIVTQGAVENLVTGFTRTWQRPPTEDELRGLVSDYVREEAAYREALALGLDRDDMIVRRRLQQKLEFLSDDLATRIQPGDADLQSFLQAHKGTFQTEPLFSLRQIYFNPQLHGENLRRDAARVLDRLRTESSHKSEIDAGDPFLLQQNFDNVSPAELKNTFGEKFASAISALPVGSWQGPIDSGYGAHLVYVAKYTPSRLPDLVEVREQVRRDYFDARRRAATDQFYNALLHRYSVRIEPPQQKKEVRKDDKIEDQKEEKKLGQLR